MDTHTTIDLLSPVSLALVAAAAAIVAVAWALARFAAGPPAAIARRWGLRVIRAVVVLTLVALLANPVRVDETPGPLERPEVFYLLDASQSMALGDSMTRWEQAVQTIRETDQQLHAEARPRIALFRFGQRLAAVEAQEDLARLFPVGMGQRPEVGGQTSEGSTHDSPLATPLARHSPLAPTDPDTRLAAALRQLSSRFGRVPPASVVLFSDGRARDAAAVGQVTDHFAQLGVPIHVVPVGDTGRGGDVAIVGAVAPARVRKSSEVEVHVFLRSFGYDGRRTDVQLNALDDGTPRQLESLPVTLRSGIQSVSLRFQSDERTQRLEIATPPLEDEISTDNNRFTTAIAIDRTKIRVLYIEGSNAPTHQAFEDGRVVTRGPYTLLQQALQEDPDVECVVVPAGRAVSGLRMTAASLPQGLRVFPETLAELTAFDAIILSSVERHAFSDQQLEWIEHWIERRGGGLLMVGGPQSFAAGGWEESVVAAMLPVAFDTEADWAVGEMTMRPTADRSSHPIWRIVSDENHNREILGTIPPFAGSNRLRPKPEIATVLATGEGAFETAGSADRPLDRPQPGFGNQLATARAEIPLPRETAPVIVAGQYGRGRTMAFAPAITAPWAMEFDSWGEGDNRYYAKFWRNVVYWLTENSSIGRRRLVATADKRFYRPGESIQLQAAAWDEGAARTTDYRLVAMIEPQSALFDLDSFYAPVLWPDGVERLSGEDGPFVVWGEELDVPRQPDRQGYGLELPIAEALPAGSGEQSLRVELTAYEGFTQVDSTSLDIQILDDPFELQNPLPDHELLQHIASQSGGQVLSDAASLAAVLSDLPIKTGPPLVKKSPLWSNWWLLTFLLVLLTVEWVWRRSVGLG